MQEAILTQIRLPRVFLAGIVGAGLAVSGAAMQGLFRNPLADPGLIGVSSGAALMVALFIVLGGKYAGLLGLYGMSIAAFGGGLIVSVLIFKIAASSGTFSVTYLLLAGIAINALSGAGTGFLTYLSDDQQLRTFTFWAMGSLGGALWPIVIVTATIIVPTIFILTRHGQSLNIMMLGEDEAKYLGVNTKNLKWIVVVCAALCVGASVAASGMIGFIGLLVPHLIRLLVSSDHRQLIPLSAMFGAILLILADTLGACHRFAFRNACGHFDKYDRWTVISLVAYSPIYKQVCNMIQVNNVFYEIGEKKILSDISLSMKQGQMLAILGANGAGKSTLLKLMTGSLAVKCGSISLNDKPLGDYSIRELSKKRAVLSQVNPISFPFTAFEIVMLGALHTFWINKAKVIIKLLMKY